MQQSIFTFDETCGQLENSSIRYTALRPDVVMGVLRETDNPALWVDAMAKSARANALASFEIYQSQGGGREALLKKTLDMAPRLGWGLWAVKEASPNAMVIEVENSPFAQAARPSTVPTCGFIRGVLEAMLSIYANNTAQVEESACTACGAPKCLFTAIWQSTAHLA